MAIHLFLAHFPVAFLLAGAAADLLGAALGREGLRRAGGALVMIGAAAALLAFVTGQGALSRALLRGTLDPVRLEAHTQWAAVGVWVIAAAGALRVFWPAERRGPRAWATLVLSVAAAAIVVGITLSGTEIAHGFR